MTTTFEESVKFAGAGWLSRQLDQPWVVGRHRCRVHGPHSLSAVLCLPFGGLILVMGLCRTVV